MKKIIDILVKRNIHLYIFFGILTTLINIASFSIFFYSGFSTVISTSFACFIAISFAYLTNRKWVFESNRYEKKAILYEFFLFFSCRIVNGILEVIYMYVAVDILLLNPIIMKMCSNIMVIILNYISSKVIVFK